MTNIWCATGHRPDKLGGYSDEVLEKLVQLAGSQLDYLSPDKMIVGMAQGWDWAVAYACIRRAIPYVAAVPCKGQEKRWPPEAQARYRNLLVCAHEVVILAPFFTPAAMYARNRWMVDHSESVLALWNGDETGGTYQCYKYALQKKRHIVNCWANLHT